LERSISAPDTNTAMADDDASTLPSAQALYDGAACGLLLTRRDGTIVRVNQTFCGSVGYTAAELVGRKMQELLTMGGRIFHQTHWAPLLQMQGSVAEVKLEVLHRNGNRLPMLMNAVRREHAGAVFHELSVAVAEDRHQYERELLLARTRAEEALQKEQEAQRQLKLAQAELNRESAAAKDRALFAEQMVGIVSHDLRNPLSAIQMSAHLLGRGELTSNQRRVIDRMVSATGRANRLIADLLDFTQARVGQGLKVAPRAVDLHSLVSESVEELGLSFPDHRLVHHRRGEGACMADADRLAQLIGNLVANAMAYGDTSLPVTVTSSIEAMQFSVAVHNEGIPIPADVMPHLFQPMTRGRADAPSDRGVGLGLFIVCQIARAHGGDVHAESSAGAGTTFTSTFPREIGP
jgi:sigma-B regulation protein RsbU (phosphoserine phosphatase)